MGFIDDIKARAKTSKKDNCTSGDRGYQNIMKQQKQF